MSLENLQIDAAVKKSMDPEFTLLVSKPTFNNLNSKLEKNLDNYALRCIMQFIKLGAPINLIEQFYHISSEDIIKILVKYIDDNNFLKFFDDEDNIVESNRVDLQKEKSDDVQNEPTVGLDNEQNESVELSNEHSLDKDIDSETFELMDYIKKSSRKGFFHKFIYADYFIIKACRLADAGTRKSHIADIFGIEKYNIYSYFNGNPGNCHNDLKQLVIKEYKQHYSILKIYTKFELTYYDIYTILKDSGNLNCEKSFKVENKKLAKNMPTIPELIKLERNLGTPIEEIANKYGYTISAIEGITKGKITEKITMEYNK